MPECTCRTTRSGCEQAGSRAALFPLDLPTRERSGGGFRGHIRSPPCRRRNFVCARLWSRRTSAATTRRCHRGHDRLPAEHHEDAWRRRWLADALHRAERGLIPDGCAVGLLCVLGTVREDPERGRPRAWDLVLPFTQSRSRSGAWWSVLRRYPLLILA